MSELTKALPNATIVRRTGLVNAWDDDNFRAAVEATGAKQVIVSGITTDVCEYFPPWFLPPRHLHQAKHVLSSRHDVPVTLTS